MGFPRQEPWSGLPFPSPTLTQIYISVSICWLHLSCSYSDFPGSGYKWVFHVCWSVLDIASWDFGTYLAFFFSSWPSYWCVVQVPEEWECLSFYWVLPASLQQKWSIFSHSLSEEWWRATSPLSSAPGQLPSESRAPQITSLCLTDALLMLDSVMSQLPIRPQRHQKKGAEGLARPC